MTSEDAFVRAVGTRIAHCTARTNLDGIMRFGLQPPAELARLAGTDAASLALRRERVVLHLPQGTAQLNHQLPIVNAYRAASAVLDGYSPESWATELDERIFFWPQAKGKKFQDSIARDAEISTLWFDTRSVFRTLLGDIDLSPINSGNFTQGGARARRGKWIYVPLRNGLDAFRANRQARGLVKGRDSVGEISVRRPLPATLFDHLGLQVT